MPIGGRATIVEGRSPLSRSIEAALEKLMQSPPRVSNPSYKPVTQAQPVPFQLTPQSLALKAILLASQNQLIHSPASPSRRHSSPGAAAARRVVHPIGQSAARSPHRVMPTFQRNAHVTGRAPALSDISSARFSLDEEQRFFEMEGLPEIRTPRGGHNWQVFSQHWNFRVSQDIKPQASCTKVISNKSPDMLRR